MFDSKNPMKTILVVDDEPKIVKLVRDYLERAGFAVHAASDGKSALSLARTERPDLIVLDLGLPHMDGLDVTRELRKLSTVPIIMLTARSEESDKLIGLELGADDYITKPFSPKELVARVRVVFRRMETYVANSAEIIRGGSSPAPNCWVPCMESRLSPTSAPSTPTSRISATRSSQTRLSRAIS
jgi:DNA-binding response OmpR family regulator